MTTHYTVPTCGGFSTFLASWLVCVCLYLCVCVCARACVRACVCVSVYLPVHICLSIHIPYLYAWVCVNFLQLFYCFESFLTAGEIYYCNLAVSPVTPTVSYNATFCND